MLINYSYEKWDESPVIVTFSEKMTRIHNIPFPAVTICPEIKSKKEIFNFTAALKKFNSEEPPFYGLTENEYEMLNVFAVLYSAFIKEQYFADLSKCQ